MKKEYYVKTVFLSVLAALAIALAPSASNAEDQIVQARLNAIKATHLASLRSEALKTGNGFPRNIQAGPSSSWLKRVNPEEVNMVTNRVGEKSQDSVMINGKAYYGSGEGYASTLLKNHSLTHASDPYTGNKVDKADAVIFVDASGRAHYFESTESYSAFISLGEKTEASLAE